MSKRLILIRHAHRDKKLGHEVDNGLSDKGHKQVKRLVKYFEKYLSEDEDVKPKFYTSPRKRCVETITPIADCFSEKVEVLKLLDEGSFLEERVQEFIKWWATEAPALTVLSSHGDWIPFCVYMMTGARIELKKGAAAEITGPTGAPHLYSLIQDF